MASCAKAYSVIKVELQFGHKPFWDLMVSVGFPTLKRLFASLASVKVALFYSSLPIFVCPLLTEAEMTFTECTYRFNMRTVVPI